MCWQKHSDEYGPISCAAIALAFCINGVDRPYRNFAVRPHLLRKEARELQEEMGWGEFVTIDEMRRFLIKYPKFRLSIVMSEKSSRVNTYQGREFVECTENLFGASPSPYYIYIHFDMIQRHYVGIRHVQQYYRARFNSSYKYCHGCVKAFVQTQDHLCENSEWKANKPIFPCKKCGLSDCKSCKFVQCENCSVKYLKETGDTELHRCMLMDFGGDEKGFDMGDQQGKKPALWVYDLEARINTEFEEIQIEEFDEEGYQVEFVEIQHQQVANYCYAVNVFSGEKVEFFGDQCLDDFITFMLNYNQGRSIALAHNGSGYDTRMIYESLLKRPETFVAKPIMRGTKFLDLKVNRKLMFRDSMNHLNGGLAGLAKDFETPTAKGYFPHLFNHTANYNYKGPIPDKKFFDLSHFKKAKDLETFNKWHDEFEGEWEFMDQLKKYCQNDVEVLASVVKKYHDIYMEKFSQSPWKYMTSSSYFHKISKMQLTLDMELPDPKSEEFASAVAEKYKDYWTVLRPVEYAGAKQALRGGRTGIGRVFCELTEEQIARGCKIKYVDVVSLYPFQQVAHDFPVGPPKIHVFDSDFSPCIVHRNSFNVFCDCPMSKRYHTQTNYMGRMVDVEVHDTEWDTATLLSKHGFVMATVEPPQMLHPILVRYEEDAKKCNATCEVIEKGCFTSIEFHTALKNGYKVLKLHRFDEYQMKAPLWEDFVKEMYIFKMVNSRSAPEGQELQDLITEYEDKFEMGDMIAKTLEPNIWGKNPARKAAAKTGLNAGWGKHAQRMILTEARYIDWKNSTLRRSGDALFHDVQNGLVTLNDACQVGDERYLYQYKKDGLNVKHDFANCYLPAACFVPAYGRMQLWEQLKKLGDRVLMYDTDSVVYIYDPDEYNVEQSKVWGGWEEEDISVAGITGFIGLGPKSYAMRCADESMNVVKLKGISQRHATGKMLNYESLKEMVLQNVASREKQVMNIPQTTFEYKMTKGIYTVKVLKKLSFDIQDQKGQVGKNYFMYPKGYKAEDYIPI